MLSSKLSSLYIKKRYLKKKDAFVVLYMAVKTSLHFVLYHCFFIISKHCMNIHWEFYSVLQYRIYSGYGSEFLAGSIPTCKLVVGFFALGLSV